MPQNGMDLVVELASGDVEAGKVLVRVLKEGGQIDPDAALGGLSTLLTVQHYSLRGAGIVVVYEMICKRDLSKFIAIVRAMQLDLLEADVLKLEIESQGQCARIDADAVLADVQRKLPDFAIRRAHKNKAAPSSPATEFTHCPGQ